MLSPASSNKVSQFESGINVAYSLRFSDSVVVATSLARMAEFPVWTVTPRVQHSFYVPHQTVVYSTNDSFYFSHLAGTTTNESCSRSPTQSTKQATYRNRQGNLNGMLGILNILLASSDSSCEKKVEVWHRHSKKERTYHFLPSQMRRACHYRPWQIHHKKYLNKWRRTPTDSIYD